MRSRAGVSLALAVAAAVVPGRLAAANSNWQGYNGQGIASQCNPLSVQGSRWFPIKVQWNGSQCLAPTLNLGQPFANTTWLITISLTGYSTTGGAVYLALNSGSWSPWTVFYFNQTNTHQTITHTFIYSQPANSNDYGDFPMIWANGNFTMDSNDSLNMTAVQLSP